MFWAGQKVVCIDPVNDLVKDKIYTVLLVSEQHMDVEESSWRFPCGSFFKRRFRPVVFRKTDIGIFHEILRAASPKVRA